MALPQLAGGATLRSPDHLSLAARPASTAVYRYRCRCAASLRDHPHSAGVLALPGVTGTGDVAPNSTTARGCVITLCALGVAKVLRSKRGHCDNVACPPSGGRGEPPTP